MGKKNISRRDFLKGIAAGAVTIGTMGVLNACESTSTPEAITAAETTTITATEAALEAANEVAKKAAGAFTPGTYTAKATGMGEIVMTATFDETSITDIKLDLSKETADIGQAAEGDLIARALEAQSSEFDAVSGATITTNAVKKCLDDVIAQASGNASGAAGATAASNDDWLGKEPNITDSDIKETINTEVLVIGLGVAGVAAARAAA
jgi:uncharacterized protein with FMN-binding domain